jgi:glycosyltransferase involved in cell wall biosynthesis
LKILHLTYWYPTEKQPLKGVFIKKHVQAAFKAGCDVRVLHLSIEPSAYLFKKNTLQFKDEAGVPVMQISVQSKFYKWFHILLFLHKKWILKEFQLLHNQHQFNVLHGHVLYPAAIWTNYLSRLSGIPYILTEHWSKTEHFFKGSLYAIQGRKAYEQASRITAVSTFLELMIKRNCKTQKIQIIGNVLNDSVFYYRKKSLPANTFVFTAVAHWYPPKRPDLLFNGLKKLSENHPDKNISLNIIGEGTLLEALKKQNWDFTINYLGQKTAFEISDFLLQSHYFLHASETETFSVVIAEALATGTPVLASNKGAIPDLITQDCGFLADNTEQSWYEGLEKLIKHQFDHQKISASVERFRESEIGLKFKSLYEEVVKN